MVCAELVRKRKQSAVEQNLLLGFKPVELFVESIEQRYGDVATVCVDLQGGSFIGIKWRSAVSVIRSNKQSGYVLLRCMPCKPGAVMRNSCEIARAAALWCLHARA